jgi:lysozyme
MINTIIDIYHGNSINFQQVKEAGIVAIIHKATQGATTRDSTYQARRQEAKAMGFLWGAYHFSSGGSVSDQVENFLTYARPEADELISLDWEPSSSGPNMTLDQARHFVQMIKDETGRWPVVYGGSLLREQIGHQADPVLSNCPLWYVRYNAAPIGIPTQVWSTYTLWQYTDGNDGPQPRTTPGVGGADRNQFQGTLTELRSQWPFTRAPEGVSHGAGFAAILSQPPTGAIKKAAKKASSK